jgi:hypothetical protein
MKQNRFEPRQDTLSLLFSVEWQRWLVLGEAVAVGVFGILLLQVSRVRQQDRTQFGGRFGTEDRTRKAVLDQQWKVARVVKVRMRQDHRIDRTWGDR